MPTGDHHLLQEVMKRLGRALATSCVVVKKMRRREAAIERGEARRPTEDGKIATRDPKALSPPSQTE
ncbi:hypothetical protein ACSQ67_025702 [Phaseolus vulgaris]